jgi:hypothetical protein
MEELLMIVVKALLMQWLLLALALALLSFAFYCVCREFKRGHWG